MIIYQCPNCKSFERHAYDSVFKCCQKCKTILYKLEPNACCSCNRRRAMLYELWKLTKDHLVKDDFEYWQNELKQEGVIE